jgi:hypothetical protein
MAIGLYNVGGGNPSFWVDTDPLFEIGNGSDDLNRANAMTVLKNGNVGIGTTTPAYKLDVPDIVQMSGFKMPTGASNGYVLTSDATGVGSWQTLSAVSDGDWLISGNDMYSNVSGNVGIGTSSPIAPLHLASGGTVLFGADTLGAGSKLMWLPSKSAFRVGGAFANEWDWDNIGDYSTAMGALTEAFGDGSTAMGFDARASGAASTAMGFVTRASGHNSTAMGNSTKASGENSTAIGYFAEAGSFASTAIGRFNVGGGSPDFWVDTDPLFEIGIGPSDVSRVNAMTILKNGDVGIGTPNPLANLHILDNSSSQTELKFENTDTGPFASQRISFDNEEGELAGIQIAGSGAANSNRMRIFNARAGGTITFATAGMVTRMTLTNDGHVIVPVLEIEGGSDLAEPFPMTDDEKTPPGALVIIDDENPGALKLSDQPYDRRVAGVVSGAGGIKTGLTLSQEGVLEDGKNVALAGRVYVKATSTNGPIKPGDLLTTSGVPGYAMKVTNYDRSHGAVIGKAMSSLEEDTGLVLVLVSLQ